MLATTPRLCPTCSVEVPARTGKYCPACGQPMDASAAAAAMPATEVAPAERMQAAELPGLEVAPAMALPLALAAGGALVGALLWAAIMYATNMEVGYVAWGVGALAGGGTVLGGGRGQTAAVLAAALALVGIVGGKFLGVHLMVEQQLGIVEAQLDRTMYEQLRAMAMADDDAPAAPDAETQLDDEPELAAAMATALQVFRDPAYTFERWRADQMAALHGQIPIGDLVRESLGPMDLLFALLGLTSAFGIVRRARPVGAAV